MLVCCIGLCSNVYWLVKPNSFKGIKDSHLFTQANIHKNVNEDKE